MAPELIAKKRHGYNEKIDVWSYGIFAIELSNGEPPYLMDRQDRVLYNIMKKRPPKVDKRFSKEFQEFTALCLTKDPSKRASVKELLQHPFMTGAGQHKEAFKAYAKKWMAKQKNPMKN